MAQTINVNLTPGLFMPALHYSQGDVGRQFIINLATSDGTPIPNEATVKMEATKPSGFGFSVSGSLSGSVATFTTTAEMTDECGRFPAEIKLTSDSTVIGTANFWLDGEKDPHPEGTIDGQQGSVIPALTLLVERAEDAAERAEDAADRAEEAASAADVKVLNKMYGTDSETYHSQLYSGEALLSNADFGTLGYVEATASGTGPYAGRVFQVTEVTSLRLSDGGIVLVKFNVDSGDGATLSIHEQDVAYTGDIPIYVNGVAISAGDIKAGDVVALSYDNGNNRWHVIGRSYSQFTSSSDGLVPGPGNVSETGEWRLLSNEGWLTVGVVAEYDSPKIPWARKYSAELSGVPTAPTATASTDTTQIATTAFVHDVVDAIAETTDDAEYSTALTPVATGTTNHTFYIFPTDPDEITLENILKIKAYHNVATKAEGDYQIYPLIITGISTNKTYSYIAVYVKTIYQDVQSTTAYTLSSGNVHFVCPFEVDHITQPTM